MAASVVASCNAISLQRQSVFWLQSPQPMGANELLESIWSGTGWCRLTIPSKEEGSAEKSLSSLEGESKRMVWKSFPEPLLDPGDEATGDGGEVYDIVKRVVGTESFFRFAG